MLPCALEFIGPHNPVDPDQYNGLTKKKNQKRKFSTVERMVPRDVPTRSDGKEKDSAGDGEAGGVGPNGDVGGKGVAGDQDPSCRTGEEGGGAMEGEVVGSASKRETWIVFNLNFNISRGPIGLTFVRPT